MSERSFKRWQYAPKWITEILSTFAFCLAQTPDESERFQKLGAKDVRFLGNLKYAADPLPFDLNILKHFQGQIGQRPVWLMASTHAGEDEIALTVHGHCVKRHPDLLTIIVPRHATRGDDITKLIKAKGLSYTRRSQTQPITKTTAVYLADTIGELGTFYRLAPTVVIGGSFVWSGHNPIEAAQLERAIVFGPNMSSFATIAEEMLEAKAAIQVAQADRLAPVVATLIENTERAKDMAQKAAELATRKRDVLARVLEALKPWLERAA